ncbi:YitT family protein [Nocardioides sp. zg-1308]|uniref:membrane protein YczE n=1 Tax=Nocardioides sp. zg-1308 TaxID=2736253 RepID=UPI0034638FD9
MEHDDGEACPAGSPAGRASLVDLGPVEQLRAGRLGARLLRLYAGLAVYGASLTVMVRADLGLAPWDVLQSGITRYVPLTLGQAVVAVSFVVLLLWVPLREKPGLGTLSNAVVVGVVCDLTMPLLDRPDHLAARLLMMLLGVAMCGLATALYIGAQLGRGPRDGLMTGLARRTGLSLRLVRTGLEVAVVAVGLLLGGVIGPGTVVFAVTIGPVTQALLPRFTVSLRAPQRPRRTGER